MAQEHQQEYSYRFQDSPLWHQPRDRSREMLFRALDAIEEPVIIVDRDTRVVYVNSSYLRTFSANLSAAGVRPEEITSYKLTEMKDQTDVLPILDVLERQRPKLKYYSLCGDVLTTFSDIIPLKLEEDELLGAVILSRDTAQIAQMNQPHGLRPPFRSYKYISTKTRHTAGASSSRQAFRSRRSADGSSSAFTRSGKAARPSSIRVRAQRSGAFSSPPSVMVTAVFNAACLSLTSRVIPSSPCHLVEPPSRRRSFFMITPTRPDRL